MTYDDEQEPDGDGDWPEDESYTAGPVQVGQQIRDVRGDVIYHEGDIYVVGPGDPPEERHQAAIRLLDGDKPRESEKLLLQLLREPGGSPERVYYYLLSA
nr:hypothetical protein [Micromonospora sp. DSM 115978]